jgi:hypothetical protein
MAEVVVNQAVIKVDLDLTNVQVKAAQADKTVGNIGNNNKMGKLATETGAVSASLLAMQQIASTTFSTIGSKINETVSAYNNYESAMNGVRSVIISLSKLLGNYNCSNCCLW